MHGIFINYRRDDAAGFARSLYEHLAQEFREGQVFMDVEALREPGIDFVKEIERSLERCAVMLVLIGKTWLTGKGAGGQRRIDEPDDFVHLEIATALKRDVRVIPVLLNGAAMPAAEELPADLQLMGRRQAIVITHDDWTHDVSRLVEALAKIPGIRKRSARGRSGWSTRSLVVAGTAGAAIGLGLLVWLGFQIERQSEQPVNVDQRVYTAPDEGSASVDTAGASPAEPEATNGQPADVVATSDEVHHVQVLLASLGYDPGAVDGMNGAATVAAIRAFQADAGEAVTGRIDAHLIARLEQTTQDRSTNYANSAATDSDLESGYEPSAYEASVAREAAPSRAGLADVSGTWYDENGLVAQIVQNGNAITVGAINPATGMLQVIGAGSVQGDIVSIQYQNFVGVPGAVQAQLAADGRHMSGTDTNALLNIAVPNTWHRDHLPGN